MNDLKQKFVNVPLFYINVKDDSEITLDKNEWITVKSLTPELFEVLKDNKYKVVFVKQENIFSHGMNVLRKVLFDTNTMAVIGAEEVFEVLKRIDKCKLNIKDDLISIDNVEYKFINFSFLCDTSEIIEFDMNTEEICYKPDYYYNSCLSPIIVKGYNMTEVMLPSWHMSRCDNEGRIWDKGFIFPYQFFDYFSLHTEKYYNYLLEYIEVLKEIYSLRFLTESSKKLKYLLTVHYSYSIIFSFITPNISEKLKEDLGNEGVEKVYNLFVMNSPIHNKKDLTNKSLEKMGIFLRNVLKGIQNKENYSTVYHVYDIPLHDMALMYFVTNMFSDIRRCVINIIIENNPWFESICQHRKKVKIY